MTILLVGKSQIKLLLLLIMLPSYLQAQSMIIDFSNPQSYSTWRISNDTVMGGVSKSHYETLSSMGRFQGNVSLDNNGGFASIEFIPLRAATATIPALCQLQLTVKGDGKRYQLRLKTADNLYGEAYIAEFTTQAQQITEHRFNASDFQLGFRGRRIVTEQPINFAEINAVGILIAAKQQGPFAIELLSLSYHCDGNA
ncbi:CIA30 family protein [Shewanella maritima]|uniref:CIA30 family protein n=1 Tax=Shewanella maritima TaxID=2520507 RepID=UPI0037353189